MNSFPENAQHIKGNEIADMLRPLLSILNSNPCVYEADLIIGQFTQAVVSLYCWTIIQFDNFQVKIRRNYTYLDNSHKPLYRCIECIVGRL